MFGYIYITTNLINNKQYIGKKKRNKFDSKYIGSGKLLWEDIKKNNYTRDDFKVEILDTTAKNLEELNELEKFYIKKYNAVADDRFYNIASGGDGGKIYKTHPRGFLGHKHSEHTKKIQSETIKKFVIDKGLNANWKNGHPKGMLGKKHTEESNIKRAESNRKSYYNYMKTKVFFPDGKVLEFNSRNETIEYLKISKSLFDKLIKTGEPYIVHKNTRYNKEYLLTLQGIRIIKMENTEVTGN